jgi:PAS domain S-box-containing protein
MGDKKNKSYHGILKDLAELSSRYGMRPEDKIQKSLILSLEYFDLDIAIISRIQNSQYEVLFSDSKLDDLSPKRGDRFHLENTYCDLTYRANNLVSIPHMSQSKEHSGHPCYREFGLESYIGTPLFVKQIRFGTFNLSSPNPRQDAFNEEQIDLFRFLGPWLENILGQWSQELEARKAKKETRKLSRLSDSFQEVARIGGWELDLEKETTVWTKEIYKIYGIPEDTLTDKIQGLSYYEKEDQKRLERKIQECIEKGTRFDDIFSFYDANGQHKWVRAIGERRNQDGDKKIIGTFQDVTEHIQAKIELEEKSNELNTFFNNSQALQCIADKEGALVKANQAFLDFFGYLKHELRANHYATFIHPEDRSYTVKLLEGLCPESPTVYYHNRVLCKDNIYRTVRWTVNLDSKKSLYYVSGTEISALIDSQQEIEKHKEFLQKTLDELPAIFYAKDPSGRFLMVNNGFRNLFNLSDKEILGRTNHELFPKKIADLFRESDLKTLKSKKTEEIEEHAYDANGTTRIYHSVKFPYLDSKGHAFATGGISMDITEKKEFEKEAFQNSKMSSIGQMAAGMGHEINNPLAIIKGYLGIVQDKLKKVDYLEDKRIETYFEKMETASDRIASIVKGIRLFSKNDLSALEVIDLYDLLEETAKNLRELYAREGASIEWQEKSTKINYHAKVDRARVQQLFINLISNAKDASKTQKARKIKISFENSNNFVRIAFQDNGSGIPSGHRERIFDPFFTTKGINEGVGLGLSIAHDTVQRLNGSIDFKTSSEGTTFFVELPLSDERIEIENPEKADTTESFSVKKATHNVLIVEDEEALREALEVLLQNLGVDILSFSDSIEALEYLKLSSRQYDAILSDIKMPGLDGIELSKEIRKLETHSNLQIVLMTGGVDLDIKEISEQNPGLIDNFLYKPFHSEDLQNLLRTLKSNQAA